MAGYASVTTKVLIVDDEENQRTGLASMISSWGFAAETAADGVEALEKIAESAPHVIITDLMMPRLDGFELLRRLGTQGSMPPAIVLTAFGNIETAVATMHDLGAYWFLEKPIQPNALRVLLERAASHGRLAEEAERLQRQLSYQGVLGNLVGQSAVMQQVFSLVRQVAPSKAAVLITGESGTGKELVARGIHEHSPRRNGPFVAINCAAMPETLMESELFGHEKGAFTDATARRTGQFELANTGTLFLDEIGDLSLVTQAKLLRVLQEREFTRIGGVQPIKVDVRIVTATNKNLDDLVRKGQFREDLYYRLGVMDVHLPPLRDRGEDVVLMALCFLKRAAGESPRIRGYTPAALRAIRAYGWPGNVRE
ncbi:MAG TPA: transcriptional regulator, partial [Solibacterales bacterium]|nr:transcriptional regulator [Bryobacterales bacterium]